jgi:hypothetical protein
MSVAALATDREEDPPRPGLQFDCAELGDLSGDIHMAVGSSTSGSAPMSVHSVPG